MSLSGISVQGNVIDVYRNKRYEKKEGGLVLKITDDMIEIEHNVTEDFGGLVGKLPEAEPRYILYDVPIQNRANIDDLKTVFILWMPMESPVRQRMMYSSTKAVITKSFDGIAVSLQEEEKDALNMDRVKNKIRKAQGINNP